MRVELSRCEVRRPPFYSTGVVCLSVEAFIGVLCEAIRSTNGKPLQDELVELGKITPQPKLRPAVQPQQRQHATTPASAHQPRPVFISQLSSIGPPLL